MGPRKIVILSGSTPAYALFLRVSGMPLSYWSRLDELNARFNNVAYADQSVLLAGSDGHE